MDATEKNKKKGWNKDMLNLTPDEGGGTAHTPLTRGAYYNNRGSHLYTPVSAIRVKDI